MEEARSCGGSWRTNEPKRRGNRSVPVPRFESRSEKQRSIAGTLGNIPGADNLRAISRPGAAGTEKERADPWRRIMERLRSVPGVVAARPPPRHLHIHTLSADLDQRSR